MGLAMFKFFEIGLPGSVRSKKNSKTATIVGGKKKPRKAIIIPSKAYQEWEEEVRQTIKSAVMADPKLPTEKPIGVRVTAYIKGVMPDLSGVLESVGDCLEGLVYKNDSQIRSWDGSRVYRDKHNPRTIVEVFELED